MSGDIRHQAEEHLDILNVDPALEVFRVDNHTYWRIGHVLDDECVDLSVRLRIPTGKSSIVSNGRSLVP